MEDLLLLLKDLETGVQDLPVGTPILIGVGPVFGMKRQQQQIEPCEVRMAGALT